MENYAEKFCLNSTPCQDTSFSAPTATPDKDNVSIKMLTTSKNYLSAHMPSLL